jgi:hypothetical protein
MLSKRVLEQAKAFLCWDCFSDVTVKLIPLQGSVAFYYPPSPDYSTIVVFYPARCQDFSEALFLLFHEIGHYLQFQEYRQQGKEQQFWKYVHSVDGLGKMQFEQESWERGQALFQDFLHRQKLNDKELLANYDNYAIHCVESYHHEKDERPTSNIKR